MKQDKKTQEKKYKIQKTKNELIQDIRDIEINKDWELAMRVRNGIRLEDERIKKIRLIQQDEEETI